MVQAYERTDQWEAVVRKSIVMPLSEMKDCVHPWILMKNYRGKMYLKLNYYIIYLWKRYLEYFIKNLL